MKNQIKYISDIQPVYGISRYRYYEVLEDSDGYYIVNDYGTKIYYSEEKLKELFSTDNWNIIFVKENIVKDDDVEEKIEESYKSQNDINGDYNQDSEI